MELVIGFATFGMAVVILYHVLKTEQLAKKGKQQSSDDVSDNRDDKGGN